MCGSSIRFPIIQGGQGAKCTNGCTLDAKEIIDLTGYIDGKLHNISLKDMGTTMSIAQMLDNQER